MCQIQAKGYEENVVRAKGFVHFAKGLVPFGPTATMDACQIQAKAHGAFSAQAKQSMVKIAMSRGLWREPIKWTQVGHKDTAGAPKNVFLGGWRQTVRDFLQKVRVFWEGGRRERG